MKSIMFLSFLNSILGALHVASVPLEIEANLTKRSPLPSNPGVSCWSSLRRRPNPSATSYERLDPVDMLDVTSSYVSDSAPGQEDIEAELEAYEQNRLNRINIILNDINVYESTPGLLIEDDMRRMKEADREASNILQMVLSVANESEVHIANTLQDQNSREIWLDYEKNVKDLRALIQHCQVVDECKTLKDMVPHNHLNEVKRLAMGAISSLNLLRLHYYQLCREYRESHSH